MKWSRLAKLIGSSSIDLLCSFSRACLSWSEFKVIQVTARKLRAIWQTSDLLTYSPRIIMPRIIVDIGARLMNIAIVVIFQYLNEKKLIDLMAIPWTTLKNKFLNWLLGTESYIAFLISLLLYTKMTIVLIMFRSNIIYKKWIFG